MRDTKQTRLAFAGIAEDDLVDWKLLLYGFNGRRAGLGAGQDLKKKKMSKFK
jgi:hypothetical protein